MTAVDFNCFTGGWPFHKVRNKNFKDIKRLHEENDISWGFLSSTDAIFYNDPYEAEKELHEEIKDTEYKQVITVNPKLPGTLSDIHRAVRELAPAGVRILPGFHDYTLKDSEVKELMEVVKSYGLPLFLTLRMEDERCTYLFHPKSVPLEDVSWFIKEYQDIKTLLCNIRMEELEQLKEILQLNPRVFFDSSGLKDLLFPLEKLEEYGVTERLVYGSLAPVFCLRSTLLLIKEDKVEEVLQERILTGYNFFVNELQENNRE